MDTAGRGERPGLALTALVAILVITAAWWALALWPAAAEPEWLTRTRAACFGSERGGLPATSGWILLIGEPIGMLVMLVAIGGRALRRDFAWLAASRWRHVTALAVAAVAFAGTMMTGVRVARAWEGGRAGYGPDRSVLRSVDYAAPSVSLVDQEGRRLSLADWRGRPALVTFAFGHCATVCPLVVNDLQAARRRAGRSDVPLLVVTLDPWRDTPDRLATLAQHWSLGPDDRVLSGTIEEVEAALDTLRIARRRNETTGDVDHATTVLVVGGDGRIGWRTDGGVAGIEKLLDARSLSDQ